MEKTRTAIIRREGWMPQTEAIRAYLPFNYEVVAEGRNMVVIEGTDSAGWTMDGYVIPRLGSGNITAREVTFEAS